MRNDPDEFTLTNPESADAANAAVIEIALAERLRASTAYASRVELMAADYDVPLSTLRAALAKGCGPKTFTIGRLIYCRRADWTAWLDGLAEKGGTGPLSPPASRAARLPGSDIRPISPVAAVTKGNTAAGRRPRKTTLRRTAVAQ